MPSGSLTVIPVASTVKITVYGSIVLTPMKSPGITNVLGSEEVVRTLVTVEVQEVTVMVKAVGIAPTHCAILLTRALADWINSAAITYLVGMAGLYGIGIFPLGWHTKSL